MIVVTKWAGLVTNASPYSVPPGAAVTQVNLQVISPGQIAVRPGMAAVTFDSVTGLSGYIRSAMRYPGSKDSVVCQTAAGTIVLAQGPN